MPSTFIEPPEKVTFPAPVALIVSFLVDEVVLAGCVTVPPETVSAPETFRTSKVPVPPVCWYAPLTVTAADLIEPLLIQRRHLLRRALFLLSGVGHFWRLPAALPDVERREGANLHGRQCCQ